MVSIMDERARAIFEEARETLARVADVEVEYRFHDDDGMLSPWSRGMPKKPAPPPPLTVADVERKIADALPESRLSSIWFAQRCGGNSPTR